MADRETVATATALLDLCKAKKLMVATAESCTGGLVAGALTEISGSSPGGDPRVRHLHQQGQAPDAGSAAGDAGAPRRSQPRDRGSDGEWRARPRQRRSRDCG